MFIRNSNDEIALFDSDKEWMNLGVTLFNDGGADPEGDVDTDPEGDDTDNDDDAEWTPPTKADFEKLEAASKAASAEAKAYRTKLTKNGIDPKTGKPKGAPATDDKEDDKPSGPTSTELKLFSRVVTSSLKEAGAKASGARLLSREFDIADIDIDDDDAISDKINELKEEYPDLFDVEDDKPAGRTAGNDLGRTAGKGVKKELNSTQQLFKAAGI